MIIRHVKPSDIDEMFSKFCQASITKEDIKNQHPPKSGFYEYQLSFSDFEKRALSQLSLVCINNGRVVSYIISYTIKEANKMREEGVVDPILEKNKES